MRKDRVEITSRTNKGKPSSWNWAIYAEYDDINPTVFKLDTTQTDCITNRRNILVGTTEIKFVEGPLSGKCFYAKHYTISSKRPRYITFYLDTELESA